MERTSEIFSQNWKEIREKGRLRYALKQGVIMTIVVTVIRGLLSLRTMSFSEIIENLDIYNLLILFVGAVLGYYVIMWWIYENQYHKNKKND